MLIILKHEFVSNISLVSRASVKGSQGNTNVHSPSVGPGDKARTGESAEVICSVN